MHTRLAIASFLVLSSLLAGCPNAPPQGTPPTVTSTTPSAAPSCGPTAYRHPDPAFCVEVPASAKLEAPTTTGDNVLFRGELGSMTVSWGPRSDAATVAAWKATQPGSDRTGVFEVLKTEPLPAGTFMIIHDATQSKTKEIFKVPSVYATTIVEGDRFAFRCVARINLEHGEDAAKVVAANPELLDACRSLRPL